MSMLRTLRTQRELPDPGFVRFAFGNTLTAPLWTAVRLYLGWQWLSAGWHKVSGDGWVNNGGSALQGFWTRIVAPEATSIHYGWYHNFIQYMLDHQWYEWFAKVVAYGETAIGLALIIGLFTGIAAISGAFMNFNFMLAGSASTNPVLFILAVLLVLAWKVAGYIGMDRWVLPAVGTPWAPLPALREAPPPGGVAAPPLHA